MRLQRPSREGGIHEKMPNMPSTDKASPINAAQRLAAVVMPQPHILKHGAYVSFSVILWRKT